MLFVFPLRKMEHFTNKGRKFRSVPIIKDSNDVETRKILGLTIISLD